MSASLIDDSRLEPLGDAPTTAKHQAAQSPGDAHLTIIEPSAGWRLINWRELSAYRDLLRLLIWRSIKARYAQSIVGVGWAIIQPLFQMLTFTLVFGKVAKIESDGVPYAAFSLVGIVPWSYYSGALSSGANSLVTNAHMISKIYFPRLVLPLADVFAKLFDFAIAMALAVVALSFIGWSPNAGVLMLPYLVVLTSITALGLGLWLSALAIQYRDVNHALVFVVQLMMYAAPVIYPTSLLPERYTMASGIVIWPQWIYALNPMVGVIEGFRSALLSTRPMPFGWIALGTATSLVTLATGIVYFRSREKLFADVA